MRLIIFLVACASAPKPAELEALEKLRTQSNLAAAQKRSPDISGAAEALYNQAHQEWQSKELEQSRRDALLSSIKLKTALALAAEADARARITRADADLAKSEAEYAQVAKELATANEQIALLRKLGAAQSSAATEKARLAEAEARSAAQSKLTAAELSLRTADLVNAAQYSKDLYSSAKDLLERANSEMKQNNFSAAQTSAEMAKSKADDAAKAARPEYDKSEQKKSDRARDEALTRDASSIPGVTVRLERRGEAQRLVMPLSGFSKGSTAPAGADDKLDGIAALLKKHPSYTVQIVGHTDSKGRPAELLALSQARASAILNALAVRGLDPKRFLTSGVGGDEPISDNKSAAGRALNNRVEIVLLY